VPILNNNDNIKKGLIHVFTNNSVTGGEDQFMRIRKFLYQYRVIFHRIPHNPAWQGSGLD